MLVKKKYHFYAGHRNHVLEGKCSSWHGHRYGVEITIEPKRTTAGITMLFGDIDYEMEKILSKYDHSMLLCREDPYFEAMTSMKDYDGKRMKVVVFNEPTSVENLAQRLFEECLGAGLPMDSVRIQETDSSTVEYNIWDYEGDTQ